VATRGGDAHGICVACKSRPPAELLPEIQAALVAQAGGDGMN
jgi:hypothetical protein